MTTAAKAKATPGPWHCGQRGSFRAGEETTVRAEGGEIIAECNTLANRGQEVANARLIAACPALLLTLHRIANNAGARKWNTESEADAQVYGEIEKEAKAAIAEAT